MPVYQSQSAGQISYKSQSALGSIASGSGGKILRTTGGTGGRLTKATTASNELRNDGMMVRGRHGTQKTNGTWTGELSIGSHTDIIEAVMRDTWSSPDVATTQSDFTSLTTTTSTIVLASGDPRTLGYRVGQVIRLSNQDAGNNGRNLRITGLSATTITVAETLVLNASPDSSCTITTVGKTLSQYSAASVVKRYFTIDEYDIDIDSSEVFQDFVFGSVKFGMQPNGLITCDPGGMGTGHFTAYSGSTSPTDAPWLTSPSTTTGTPLAVVDATIRVQGNDLVEVTAFDLTLDLTPNAPDVFGSGAIKYAPDVFTGQMQASMNLTVLRKDLQFTQDFAAETQYSLQVLAVENEAEPKSFFSIYVGNFTLGSVDKSALNKAGGPRTQTIAIPNGLIGLDNTGTGYVQTMVMFQQST